MGGIARHRDRGGPITGTAAIVGERRIVPPNGDTMGTADDVFTRTIEGVGMGMFTFSDGWLNTNNATCGSSATPSRS
jgi:hypothetical protein